MSLLASQPLQVEKTVATTDHPSVTLSNLRGKIMVRGWSKPTVHAVYILASPGIKVDFESDPPQGPAFGVHFVTRVVNSKASPEEETVNYTLEIPVGASLEIRNPEGAIEVDNIQGDTDVGSLGASVSAAQIGGHLAVSTITGDITVTRAAGRVEVTSVNGNLRLLSLTSSEVRAHTTLGNVLYRGGFAAGGEYEMSDYSGNMDILCPSSASFELHARTQRGKLLNSFPLITDRRLPSPLSSASSLVGTHDTGEATVDLRSFSGTIRIRPEP